MTRKQLDLAISNAFKKHSRGYQIPIMKLTNIWSAGERAYIEGEDIEDAVKSAILTNSISVGV